MRHGGRTTLARAVFPIAQPQSPRPCIFLPPAPPAKPASRQGLALTTPHALARIRRPSLPNDPNGRYASRTRPRTAHPYPCRVRHSQAPLSRRPALPGRDRKRLIRALAASAIRRPLSPADLRFPARLKTALPAHLPYLCHSQAPLPRRPALPRATENGSSALLPRLPIADPLPVDLRFPVRPQTDCPHSCRVRSFAGPSPPPTCASPARPRTFPRAVSRKRRAAACALPAWLWLSRRAMWGKKCSSFTIR